MTPHISWFNHLSNDMLFAPPACPCLVSRKFTTCDFAKQQADQLSSYLETPDTMKTMFFFVAAPNHKPEQEDAGHILSGAFFTE